jgi:hypothetical protein
LTALKLRYASRSRCCRCAQPRAAGLQPPKTNTFDDGISTPASWPWELLTLLVGSQAKSGEPQNGLAGSCRPSGQILTSLLRYGGTTHVTGPIHRVLGFQRRQHIGIREIMSLCESTYPKLPKRDIKGCTGCCTCVRPHIA